MKISFRGGAQEVGRSCMYLSSPRTSILLDAGVKLEEEKNEYPDLSDEEIRNLNGVFISHAHLDHCCFVPHLFARGFQGKVYLTKPTLELMNVQIADYMRLSEPKEVTRDALFRMNKSFKVVEYRRPVRLNDMTIEFLPAGHILGSAVTKVSHEGKSVIYTGDINLTKTKLLDGADLRGLQAETLITESTYGGSEDIFMNEKDLASSMIKSMKATLSAGGKVIIPTFGVGRGQEVLLFLDEYINSGQLPKVPIYVDGVIGKVLRIHRHNVIYCRREIQSKILVSDYDPFRSQNFVFVEKKTQRNRIVESPEASIIVTTSGMLTGGPVVYYLKRLVSTALNKLILVGYQADGTTGRALQDGAKEIDFHDSRLEVKLSVEVYHMSAHADRKQLELIPSRITGVKNIFIVHGEKVKAEALCEAFKGKYNAVVPAPGQTFEV